jgi:hypothetical protein
MANGLLDKLFAPLGQQVVDPNGQVSGMINPQAAAIAEAKRLAELKKQEEMLRQQSLMEAAAQASPAPVGAGKSSRFNPFVMLFGDPRDPSNTGLLGK